MATSYPRRQPSTQSTSSYGSRSRRSNDSYASHSTAPTSLHSSPSPRPSDLKASPSSTTSSAYAAATKYRQAYDPRNDVSPATSLYPRSSVDTYASTTASREDLDADLADPDDLADVDDDVVDGCDAIPALPVYRRDMVEPNVRASSPQDFAKLFPSLHRLTIRHDEFTSDGNMNLRIDTVVTGRRRTAIQLFHLRMYDLARREFSLRRYSRDSGREVCSAKRKFTDPAHEDRPAALKRSVSTALRSLGRPASLRRAKLDTTATTTTPRPPTDYSTCSGDDDLLSNGTTSRLSLASNHTKGRSSRTRPRPHPTNTIKLEFSNYARVDVTRRGSGSSGGAGGKRYEFDWWGHRYAWRRAVDKQLGLVSFHLVRDGLAGAPVAHIVPETRAPSQVAADECAGGWVPPCFMWIADESVVDAVTDVADVIMATGLIALVDDCIKERWQRPQKKAAALPLLAPLALTSKAVHLDAISPRAIMQHVFRRRHSDSGQRPSTPPSPSPLRFANSVAAH
ncbi:hypothetical protein C8A05DRAFT_37213 [Staphylotrichum tortipilum]|uniref:Uncharacterized protein n=1 Tax=Staphylotrichum tortipilum TaxID=2831512 RepID=A0AAN6RQ12_9PEZI|nr:hypothetical protein C8A05DRAFT_37213 [Staphylotrichum longicolle]